MATSGLARAIHSLERSNPENTRFQYGSSVCLLSIAAPIAGTCEEATPAMILATASPRLAARLRLGLRHRRRLGGLRALGFRDLRFCACGLLDAAARLGAALAQESA